MPLPGRSVSRILYASERGHPRRRGGHLSKRPTRGSRGAGHTPAGACPPSPLLGLAPGGGCLDARRLPGEPVGSYPTFSPLPAPARSALLAVMPWALTTHKRAGRWRSVSVALARGYPRPGFPGAVPCGVRTFLPSGSTEGATTRPTRPVLPCPVLKYSHPRAFDNQGFSSSCKGFTLRCRFRPG